MIPYGKRKRGSSKIHPRNECPICSEINIDKGSERNKLKKDTQEEINAIIGEDNKTGS